MSQRILRVRFAGLRAPGESAPQAVRRLLAYALDHAMDPVPELAPTDTVDVVALPPLDIATATRLRPIPGDSDSAKVERLVAAAVRNSNGPGISRDSRDSQEVLQKRLIVPGTAALDAHKIALLEGSTGIGKSRVIAALAAHASTKGPVVIAAPTVSVLSHLASEWALAGAAKPGMTCEVRLGTAQFVDPDRVRVELGDAKDLPDDQRAAVQDWLHREGAPTCEDVRRLAAIDPGLRWITADLRNLAPDFPVHKCVLSAVCPEDNDEPDTGARAAPNFLFCTHMLLAIHCHRLLMPTRGPILPPFGMLVMDEAHEFAGWIERAGRIEIPLMECVWLLRRGRNEGWWKQQRLGAAADRLERDTLRAIELLQRIEGHYYVISPGTQSGNWDNSVRRLLGGLERGLAPFADAHVDRRHPSARALETLRGWHKSIGFARDRQRRLAVVFSPAHRYPTLASGTPHTQRPLEALWKSVDAATLLSGTLHVRDAHGWSPAYIARKLHIPPARLEAPAPVHARWTRDAVTVHLPSRVHADALTFPGDAPRESIKRVRWLDAVAAVMRERILEKCQGGALVLCNSYSDIEGLDTRLAGEYGERLISQVSSGTFGAMRQQFLSMGQGGHRPIWIATGAAWTGLDLRSPLEEVLPEQDMAFTDLIVVRLPYHPPQAGGKSGDWAYHSGRHDMVIRLRQGIGRLVRRAGVANRHLWCLDARVIATQQLQWAGARSILEDFPRRVEF